jgi:hypothetical protein
MNIVHPIAEHHVIFHNQRSHSDGCFDADGIFGLTALGFGDAIAFPVSKV